MYWSYHHVSYKRRFKLNFFLWASFTICFFLRDPSKQRRHSQMGTKKKRAVHKREIFIFTIIKKIVPNSSNKNTINKRLNIYKIPTEWLKTNVITWSKYLKLMKYYILFQSNKKFDSPCTFTPYHSSTFALYGLQYRPYQTCICTAEGR